MEAGIIKNWNQAKGYGFVQMRQRGLPDAFLHISEIRNLGTEDAPPQPGDLVFFDLAPANEGTTSPKAVNVLIV
jgi:cold shock CspA family protein